MNWFSACSHVFVHVAVQHNRNRNPHSINNDVDINTLQDIAHAYLLELPLDHRVHVMRDVLGLDVQFTLNGYIKNGTMCDASKMDEFTTTYVHWMRVDESQKIFEFIKR